MTNAVVFMISQVVLVLFATNRLQGAMFRSFEEMGGKYYSVGKGVMVGVVASFIITAAWIFSRVVIWTTGRRTERTPQLVTPSPVYRTARAVLRYNDTFLLAIHASFRRQHKKRWGLPGGGIEWGETAPKRQSNANCAKN